LPVVLVVEDAELLQNFVEETLADGGFEPVIAASGEEAVPLLKGHKGRYRALVTDINLKGKMDGWEVARCAREVVPEFPVVYMSGASAADWTSKGVPNSIMFSKAVCASPTSSLSPTFSTVERRLPSQASRTTPSARSCYVASSWSLRRVLAPGGGPPSKLRHKRRPPSGRLV
jgi:CheY-like chemotaxis protein